MIVKESDLKAILEGAHRDPHGVLGMHPVNHRRRKRVVVRVFLRDAKSCEVVAVGKVEEGRFPLRKLADVGFFEGLMGDREEVFCYQLLVESSSGESRQFYDPYCFPLVTSEDTELWFKKGNERRLSDRLGARVETIDGISGVSFTVWAPSARRVSVVGDFNGWAGRFHAMRLLGNSGIWEIFLPGLGTGVKYKFEIVGPDGTARLKSDPFGLQFESPPHCASVTCDLRGFPWRDGAWLESRKGKDWQKSPMSIYEVHAGSWKRVKREGDRPLQYRELADELVDHMKHLGFTHVEFLPLAEHPFEGSWGYQVTGFFAPTHRYGTPHDFMYLVDHLHRNGIGVIIDWVPGHFPSDAFSMAQFDGTPLYEYADPRQGVHQDWGTLIFDYGKEEVRSFLIASALAWLRDYHIDGLRVDAVASMLYLDYSRNEGEWIPNKFGGRENIDAIEFLRRNNDLVHEFYPGVITIAEESSAWPGATLPTVEGGLGFDFKWNMGWMHDTLEYFRKDSVHRKCHQNLLTFGMVYQFSENFIEVFSHDEVVHGKAPMIYKMSGNLISDKAHSLRALYTLMWAWPGKNTLFMGNEFGQSSEWSHDSSLDWNLLQYRDHKGILKIIEDLNEFYCSTAILHDYDSCSEGFEWVSFNDSKNSVISFLRKGSEGGQAFLVVGHYNEGVLEGYRVGVPFSGFWSERINSNATEYGGSGVGNGGGIYTEETAHDEQPFSIVVTLPPNATIIFELGDR